MSKNSGLRSAIVSLWWRLMTISIAALVFCESLVLARGKAQGWTFYLTKPEVVFEVVVRLVAAALAGLVAGTAVLIVISPFLALFKAQRDRIAEWSIKSAIYLTIFIVSRFALQVLIKWSYTFGDHKGFFDRTLLLLHLVAFLVIPFVPRVRREVVSSMDGVLSPKVTRRTVVATVASAAALVVTEYAFSRRLRSIASALSPQRPRSNILLITFDALNAEDLSLSGFRLPTTPNIDAFARKSTVFTNYYAASTFTTPCIGVILTGTYPSESRIYGLSGQVPADLAPNTLAHLMRAGGYATGAFLTNPWAYYLGQSIPGGFEAFPEPHFHPGRMQRLWEDTTPLHQNSGVGSRIDEYFELESIYNDIARIPESLAFRFRPLATFEHTLEVLANLPDGFFVWVHAIPPHHPYLPDPADQGRWISEADVQSFKNEPWPLWKPHYPSSLQGKVDQRHLAYDEFLATTDRAFGEFIAKLENSGRLQNTTVIVSADHGESFEGGVYQHQSPYLTRPVIHIPLIVRKPGQEVGRTVGFTADQTTLAPTILDLAGLAKPESMHALSLVPWLDGDEPRENRGLAFCQYLERNSIFRPLRNGSFGVIDGEYQYVVYLDSQKGELRPLAEAQFWNLDRSAEYPERALALRAALHARFPDLIRRNA